MKESKKTVDSDRRSFLKLAGAGAVASGAVLAASGGTAEAREESGKEGHYRETEHVKTFYKLARF